MTENGFLCENPLRYLKTTGVAVQRLEQRRRSRKASGLSVVLWTGGLSLV